MFVCCCARFFLFVSFTPSLCFFFPFRSIVLIQSVIRGHLCRRGLPLARALHWHRQRRLLQCAWAAQQRADLRPSAAEESLVLTALFASRECAASVAADQRDHSSVQRQFGHWSARLFGHFLHRRPLPRHWLPQRDRHSGRVYYFNLQTGAVSQSHPLAAGRGRRAQGPRVGKGAGRAGGAAAGPRAGKARAQGKRREAAGRRRRDDRPDATNEVKRRKDSLRPAATRCNSPQSAAGRLRVWGAERKLEENFPASPSPFPSQMRTHSPVPVGHRAKRCHSSSAALSSPGSTCASS